MSAPTKGSGTSWVGRSIRRLEDPVLVAGQGRFTADLAATHWIRIVRSPVASGRIDRITLPQNAKVFTATDLQGVKPIKPMLHKFNYVPVAQPILAAGVVRFVGEPVAVAIGQSKEEAEDVADLVEIEIASLAPVTDASHALAPCAPIVHAEAPANVIVEGRVKTPDFDATRGSAHKLIEFEARSRRQSAMPLEARAGHAAYDAASGRVTLTCTTQMPHLARTAICDLLGMPESDLRVIAPDVGGGFG
ncbi:MAG: xanthine dehydrogenase family protein molybdopterin-binding subunit, partial [Bradyrhizobium sp.]